MHELPVTKSIVETTCKECLGAGFRKVTVINVVIGELSSIVGESVQMYLEIVAKDTPAEGAALNIRRVGAQLECGSCGNKFEHNKTFNCPACGGESRLIRGTGIEFYIESIEAE